MNLEFGIDGTRRVAASSRPLQVCHRSRAFRAISRLASRSDGGSLVEVAVTLPVILLIMTGIFSFSTALYQKIELAQSVGTGGRTLAVARGDTDPCKTTASAIYSAAPTLTQSSIGLTFKLNGVSTSGGTCPGASGAANGNMVSGGSAQVIATYPCTLKIYGKTFASCSLSEQITEVVQ